MAKLKSPSTILFATWVIFQTILFCKLGIHTELEAEKYISQANNLILIGHYSAPKYLFYSTIILIITFFLKVGLGYTAVVIFQILLNGLATTLLYKLSEKITVNKQISFITTFLFISFYPVQIWNVYLFTESLFISITIIFLYNLYTFPPIKLKNFLLSIPCLILLIITRPFGLLFIAPFLFYSIIISKGKFRNTLIYFSIIGIVFFFFLVNFAFNGGEDMDAMKPFREEHIICFIPSPHPVPLDLKNTGSPVYDILYYVFHNPIHFLKLMLKRLYSFFNLTRPYYSKTHNLYLYFLIIPTYAFAIIGLVKSHKLFSNKLVIFIMLFLFLYALGATFQCDDYLSRFTMPLFSFIFLLSSAGIYFIYKKLKS